MATIAHAPAVEVGKAAVLVKTKAVHVVEGDKLVAECRKHLTYQPKFVQSVDQLIDAYENTQQRLLNAQQALADEKAAHLRTKDQLTKELNKEKAEHQKTKDSLTKEKADHQTTKDQLTKEKKDHEGTKAELCKTQKELDATKTELTKVNAQLKKTKDELDTALAAIAAASIEIEKFNSENRTLRSEKDKLQADLAAANKKLQRAESDLVHLEGRRKSLEESLNQTQKEYEREHADVLALDKIRDSLKAQVDRLENELYNTKGGRFLDKENRTKDKYYIDEVVYGGKSITNPKVIDLLLGHAVAGTKFNVNNITMGEDPLPKVKKILTIAYAFDGQAPLRYLNAVERSDAKFE